jgi:D-serine deaminase-like pyridoxal phosphate-dependent protein
VEQLRQRGMQVPAIVAGGSPTFPMHARRAGVELSPGTTVLWDASYARLYPDLACIPAALLLTRVVSKPGRNRLCLDLGHKAVASEMSHPRVSLIGLEDARVVNHSEEHLVVESDDAARWNLGDHIYGIPTHICPSVARYDRAYVIENQSMTGHWPVDARDRVISV